VRALVTGASRGLGLALCEALAARGDEVVAVCRRPSFDLDALGVEIAAGIDVGTDDAIEQLRALADHPLDLVIANAGVNETYAAAIGDLEPATVAKEFEVNALGAVRTVQGLLPALAPGSKIVLITGGGRASVWKAPNLGNYGYRMSKAALNVFGVLLAEELRPLEIPLLVLSPGAMDTDMHRAVLAIGRGNPDPGVSGREAARDVVARIDELDMGGTGELLHRSGRAA
jgi:NAD(P)-dependent dehydrogenase (short-subunit alcohol dehydrogenase family)